MIYPIRYYGDPALKRKAAPVASFDAALKQLAADMIETMYDANGVGLAAPQIGINKRLFIALELAEQDAHEDAHGDAAEEDSGTPDELTQEEKKARWNVLNEYIIVNPTITSREGEQCGQDGCLSLPGLYIDDMKRDDSITMSYQDLDGGAHTLTASGHFSHVLQHEYDHLEGILFFERLPAAEQRAFKETHRQALAEMQRHSKAFLRELKEAAHG
ncbi:MAG: peptide deformylase [Deinococcota bacterium]